MKKFGKIFKKGTKVYLRKSIFPKYEGVYLFIKEKGKDGAGEHSWICERDILKDTVLVHEYDIIEANILS